MGRWKALLTKAIELIGIVGFIILARLSRNTERRADDVPVVESAQHEEEHCTQDRVPRKYTGIAKLVLTMSAVTMLILLIATGIIGGFNPGPQQPVWFSHHLHANNKHINCFFCHPYAGVSQNPGIPPVEKCMLCHSVIASNFKPIVTLRGYYDRREPIPWVRVAAVPDYVHFSHECHIARGIDCSECHGNIKAMDRVVQVKKFDMNFCVSCHWKYNVSTNCYLCHY